MKEGVCIHFTGVQNEVCDLNVKYREMVGGDDFGWVMRTPCFKEHDSKIKCDGIEFPSKEAVEKYKKESDLRLSHVNTALEKIMEVTRVKPDHSPSMDKSKKGCRGKIKCPACGNDLHYLVAGGNHHIHGACKTEGCLSWMM